MPGAAGQILTRILQTYAGVPAKEAIELENATNELQVFDTEAELLASTLQDGCLGYASDTDDFFFRKGSAWLASPNSAVGGGAAGVSGAVQFSDGASVLLADDDNFHWDDAGNILGIGTPTPFLNVNGGSADLGGTGLHVKDASAVARLAVEGSGVSFDMMDLGGGADVKHMEASIASGVYAWRSLNDDLTVNTANILLMDHATGFVGMGATAAGPADTGANVAIAGGLNLTTQGNVIHLSASRTSFKHIKIESISTTFLFSTFTTGGSADDNVLQLRAGGAAFGASLGLNGERVVGAPSAFNLVGGAQLVDTAPGLSAISGANAFATATGAARDGGGLDISAGDASSGAGIGDGGLLRLDGGVTSPSGSAGDVRIASVRGGVSFFAATPIAQVANIGTLTDSSGGAAPNGTVQALTDPADTPATADALRDDLVANLIPELRNNLRELLTKVNSLEQLVEDYGLTA